MVKLFRTISVAEGLSYLAILCVTFGIIPRSFVYSLGMLHGALFMLYLIFSLVVSGKKGWSLIIWLLLFAASVVPFAFIAVELFLRKHQNYPTTSDALSTETE